MLPSRGSPCNGSRQDVASGGMGDAAGSDHAAARRYQGKRSDRLRVSERVARRHARTRSSRALEVRGA